MVQDINFPLEVKRSEHLITVKAELSVSQLPSLKVRASSGKELGAESLIVAVCREILLNLESPNS